MPLIYYYKAIKYISSYIYRARENINLSTELFYSFIDRLYLLPKVSDESKDSVYLSVELY